MGKVRHHTFQLIFLSFLATIVFVQEIILGFLPNITLTPLFIILYSRFLDFKRVSVVVILYVIFDMLYMPISFIHIPFLLLGWMIIPILLHTVFKRQNNVMFLTVFAFFHGFIYGWIQIPPGLIMTELPLWVYFLQDLPFEFIMAISSSTAIFVAYEPLYNRLKPFFIKLFQNKKIDFDDAR